MPTTEQKIISLQQAAQSSPEYVDIVPLFIGVYDYVLGKEKLTGISIKLTNAKRMNESDNNMPLVSVTDLKVNREETVTFLSGIVEVLSTLGQENAGFLQKISTALQDGTVDPECLYSAILERRRAPVNDVSDQLAVPAPLVEYIFEIPLKTALEDFSSAYSSESFVNWQESYCPVCGSRAGMAELSGEEGRRTLSCSACSFSWPFKRMTCAYCGNEDSEKLSYFTAGDGVTRVDTCKACSRYIKTRDSRKGGSDVPLEVDDLLTIHLDLLAAKEGFERGK
jgi:FdhE protein